MARKVKVLGPANDMIPEEEFILAKWVQNAAARGLRPTKKVSYRDRNGKPLDDGHRKEIQDRVYACCALGARDLEPDTEDTFILGVVEGNDGMDCPYGLETGYTIGQAFQHALR